MGELTMNLMPYAPILAVSVTVSVLMIFIALSRSTFVAGTVSVLGLNISLGILIAQMLGYIGMGAEQTNHLFVVDNFAQFNMVVIFICALACCTLSYGYFDQYKSRKEELYLLILLSTMGALFMVTAQHLAAFFVSLELLSIPLYGMLAYSFMRDRSLESGIKYLVLSAAASATLLMGMAFIFADVGTLEFKQIGLALQNLSMTPLFILGVSMMIFGIAFKLSAAPFHTWTPDVYQGAPAPIATFLSSTAKVAMMALAARFLVSSYTLALPSVQLLIVVIATLSILVGNLLALKQTSLKRLLGYSSIAHMGYVLVVFIGLGPASGSITSMYMAVYAMTSVGAFGVITLMSSPYRFQGEADDLVHYRGLFWRRPVLTAVMTIMFLSFAGIPLTAGFISKFFAIFAAVQGLQKFLAAMIILGSAIGLYYYLRVLLTMFKRPIPTEHIEYDVSWQWGVKAGGLMLILVTFIVIYFGVLPEKLVEWSGLAVMW